MIKKVYPPRLPEWLSNGGEGFEVVLSSEALYIRNLEDRSFPGVLTEDERDISRRQLVEALSEILKGYRFWKTDILRDTQRGYLIERMSAPSELKSRPQGTGLFISGDEGSWVSLNTIDHLRFSVSVGGKDIETAYRSARQLEEEFEQVLPFAYSERYGFLTSRPAECGTGLILSFLVHIPGVIFSNGFQKLRDSLLKSGCVLKPLEDEEISSEGHIFIVHTVRSLGVDEEELLETATDTVDHLSEMEFEARDSLMSRARFQVEDKIMRGLGVLTHARMIAKQEGYALANALRLGSCEGMLQQTIDILSATELYLIGQPAHLEAVTSESTKAGLDRSRAEVFRSYLKYEE